MTTYHLVEGWTDPIDFILLADRQPLDLSGLTIEVSALSRAGIEITATGEIIIVDPATAGHVRYLPADGDEILLAANSPLEVRWKLTDPAGKSRFIPNAERDKWIVRI